MNLKLGVSRGQIKQTLQAELVQDQVCNKAVAVPMQSVALERDAFCCSS